MQTGVVGKGRRSCLTCFRIQLNPGRYWQMGHKTTSRDHPNFPAP